MAMDQIIKHGIEFVYGFDEKSKNRMKKEVHGIFTDGAKIDFTSPENLQGLRVLGDMMSKIFARAGETKFDFEKIMGVDNATQMFEGLKEAAMEFDAVWDKLVANMSSFSVKDLFMREAGDISQALRRMSDKNGNIVKQNVRFIQQAFESIDTSDQNKLFEDLKDVEGHIETARSWEERTAAALRYANIYEKILKVTKIDGVVVNKKYQGYAERSLNPNNKVAGIYSVGPLIDAIPQMQTSLQNILNMAMGKALIGLTDGGVIDVNVSPVVIKKLDLGDLFEKKSMGGKDVIEVPIEFKAKLDAYASMSKKDRGKFDDEISEGLSDSQVNDLTSMLWGFKGREGKNTDRNYAALYKRFLKYGIDTGTGSGNGTGTGTGGAGTGNGSGDASSAAIESLHQQLEDANRKREEAELAERIAQDNATAERHATDAAIEEAETYHRAMDSMQEEMDSLREQLANSGHGTGDGFAPLFPDGTPLDEKEVAMVAKYLGIMKKKMGENYKEAGHLKAALDLVFDIKHRNIENMMGRFVNGNDASNAVLKMATGMEVNNQKNRDAALRSIDEAEYDRIVDEQKAAMSEDKTEFQRKWEELVSAMIGEDAFKNEGNLAKGKIVKAFEELGGTAKEGIDKVNKMWLAGELEGKQFKNKYIQAYVDHLNNEKEHYDRLKDSKAGDFNIDGLFDRQSDLRLTAEKAQALREQAAAYEELIAKKKEYYGIDKKNKIKTEFESFKAQSKSLSDAFEGNDKFISKYVTLANEVCSGSLTAAEAVAKLQEETDGLRGQLADADAGGDGLGARTPEDVENALKVADIIQRVEAAYKELDALNADPWEIENEEEVNRILQERLAIIQRVGEENLRAYNPDAYSEVEYVNDQYDRALDSIAESRDDAIYNNLDENFGYDNEIIESSQTLEVLLAKRRELMQGIYFDAEQEYLEQEEINAAIERRIALMKELEPLVESGAISKDTMEEMVYERSDIELRRAQLESLLTDQFGNEPEDIDEAQNLFNQYEKILVETGSGKKLTLGPEMSPEDWDKFTKCNIDAIKSIEFFRKEIKEIPQAAQPAKASLEELYNNGSEAAKKAIQDMAIAENKIKEFRKIVDINPGPRNPSIPLSEEEKAEFLNVAKEYQNIIKQINDLEVVAETEDDKQRLIDLKTEAIKLHRVLRQAYAVDGNIYSYIKDYGLSYEEAEKFYSSILDRTPRDFEEQILQEYYANYDDAFDRMEQLNPEFRQQMFKDMSELEALMDKLSGSAGSGTDTDAGQTDGATSAEVANLQKQLADKDAELASTREKLEAAKEAASYWEQSYQDENVNAYDYMTERDELREKLAKTQGVAGSSESTINTSDEQQQLTKLKGAVSDVTDAVKEKTQEFLNEQSAVKKAAQSEVHALGEVEKKVNAIRAALSNVNTLLNNIKKGKDIGAGLSNININVNYKKDDKEDKPVAINQEQLKSTLEKITYNVKIAHSDTDKNANKVAIDAADLEGVLRKVFSGKPGDTDKVQSEKQLPKIDSSAVKTETDALIEQYRRILSTIEEWKTLYAQLQTIQSSSTADFRKQMLPMLENMSPELVKMIGGSFAENFAKGFKGVKTKDILGALGYIVNSDLLGNVTDQVDILSKIDFSKFSFEGLEIKETNIDFLKEAFELLKQIDAKNKEIAGIGKTEFSGEGNDEPRKESYALENTLQNVARTLTKIQENTASLKGIRLQQAVDANTDASRQVAATVEGESKSEKSAPGLSKEIERRKGEDEVLVGKGYVYSEKTDRSYRTTKRNTRIDYDDDGAPVEITEFTEIIDDYDKIRKESDKTKKTVERAQKKVDEFVAKFDSKTGGNAKFIDGFGELSGFKVTADNIDIAYNKMIMLQQKYAELEKNFRKGQSSLNPFVNAINKAQNIDNLFGETEKKFDSLTVKSESLADNFVKLADLSKKIKDFMKLMKDSPDSITPDMFMDFSKWMGEFTSIKTKVDGLIKSEKMEDKNLVKDYEELGRLRAKFEGSGDLEDREELKILAEKVAKKREEMELTSAEIQLLRAKSDEAYKEEQRLVRAAKVQKALDAQKREAEKEAKNKDKERNSQNAQVEAEVVRELIDLYKQLGKAQAAGDKDEISKLRSVISEKRGELTSVDYATDMKFKHAKSEGFEAERTKANNAALKEQKDTIERLNKLYREYGVLYVRANAATGEFGEQLKREVSDIEDKILRIESALGSIITSEVSEGFSKSFKGGAEDEATRQYRAMAKKDDADEKSRLSKIESLRGEIGKLRAEAEAVTNTAVKNAIEEEISLREELIELQKQGLTLSAEDEAYYRRVLADDTKEAKRLMAQESRDAKKQAADAKRKAKKNAMFGKAGNAVGRAENIWMRAQGEDDPLPPTLNSKIEELYGKMVALREKQIEINSAETISEADQKSLRDQTVAVNSLTDEISELYSEYEKLSEDNVKEIGLNELNVDAGIKDYKQQFEKAVMAKYPNAQIKGFDAATKTLTFTLKTGRHEFTEYTAAVRRADGALVSVQGATKKTETFLEATKRKMKEISSYMSGMSLISRAGQELKRGIQYIREIDLALTELKKVTDETEETYDKFLDTAAKTADKVGSTIQKVVSSTADWARLGMSMKDAAKFAESTQILMNVSEFTDVSQATDTLISAVQAFGYTADTSMEVVDLLNIIGNNYAISTADLAQSLTKSSASLVAAGGNLAEAASLTAVANAIIQDADSVGTALKTTSLRLRGTSVKVLEEEGLDSDGAVESTSKLRSQILATSGVDILTDTGAYKSTYQILLEIAEVWDKITDDKARAGLLELLAGKRNSSVIAALLQNPEDLKAAYEDANNASGSALRENEEYLDSIQGKIDQFNNAVQTMWASSLNSDIVKDIVEFGTTLVKIIDKIGLFKSALIALATISMVKHKMGPIAFLKGIVEATTQGITKLAGYAKGLKNVTFETNELLNAKIELTQTQLKEKLINTGLTDSVAEQIVAKTKLGKATDELSASTLDATLREAGYSKEKRKSIMQSVFGTQAAKENTQANRENATSNMPASDAIDQKTQSTANNTTVTEQNTQKIMQNTQATRESTTSNVAAASTEKKTRRVRGNFKTIKRKAKNSAKPGVGQRIKDSKVGQKFKNLGSGIGDFAKQNASTLIMLGTTLVVAMINKVADRIVDTMEEVQAEFDDAVSKLDSIESELSNLESQLEGVNDKIAEINENTPLSFTDKEELSRLEAQSAELQRQIGLAETLKEQQAFEVNKKSIEAANKFKEVGVESGKTTGERTGDAVKTAATVGGAAVGVTGGLAAAGVTNSWNPVGWVLLAATAVTAIVGVATYAVAESEEKVGDSIDNMREQYAKLQNEFNVARENYKNDASDENKKKFEEAQDALKSYQSSMAGYMSEMDAYYSQIKANWEHATTKQKQEYIDWADQMDAWAIQTGGQNAKSNAIARIFGDEAEKGFEAAREEIGVLKEKLKEAYETEDELAIATALENLNEFNLEKFLSDEEIARLYEMGIYLYEAEDALEEVVKTEAKFIDNDLGDVAKDINKIADGLASLKSAFEEVNEQGVLSAKTITSLKEELSIGTTYSDVEDVQDAWQQYLKTMMSGAATTEEMTKKTEELAQAILEAALAENELKPETKYEYVAQLRVLGIDNAEELVDDMLQENMVKEIEDILDEGDKFDLGFNALTLSDEDIQKIKERYGVEEDAIDKIVKKLQEKKRIESEITDIENQKNAYNNWRNGDGTNKGILALQEELKAYQDIEEQLAQISDEAKNYNANDWEVAGNGMLRNKNNGEVLHETQVQQLRRGRIAYENIINTEAGQEYLALKEQYDALWAEGKQKRYIIDGEVVDPNFQAKIDGLQGQIDGLVTDIEKDLTFDIQLKMNLQNKSDLVDDIQSTFDTLVNAQKEYDENGYLSVDSLQSLLALKPKYLDLLVDEEGNINLTKDALYNVARARIMDMGIEAQHNILKKATQLASEGSKDALYEEITAMQGASAEGKNFIDTQMAEIEVILQKKVALGELSQAEADAFVEGTMNQIEAVSVATQSALDNLENSLSSAGNTATAEAEDAFKKAMDYWENRIGANQSLYEQIQNDIDLLEKKGQIAGESYYQAQINVEKEHLAHLKAQRAEAAKFLEAETPGTERWWEIANVLNDIEGEIDGVTASIQDLSDAMDQVHWIIFDEAHERMEDLTSQLSNVREILSADEDSFFTDEGEWAENGIAVVATYVQEIELAKNKLADVNKELNNLSMGDFDSEQEYYDKLTELTEKQQDYTMAISDSEQAVVDMYESQIDAVEEYTQTLIDSYNDYIDSVKEALDAERD